ncbi:F-box domain-containing protein [Mycena sanguinolenta]|uniref:F-box domain-containing protein n=1 Tax=Mycena sanguinolenta TaxID=230812 RepID=A0A8H7DCA9_9AGAR|nr:F-box domain-containing protein [Mycena sanguinolenta]
MADKPVPPSTIPRDILDSNEAHPEHNFSSIREFISRGSARRAFLDAKIAPLKAELEKLLEERDSLDKEIRKHEGAVSPLRSMPPEILSLIFTFASPPHAFANKTMNRYLMNMHEGPWVLSAVCSRWRSIVLAQPSLWAHILLDFTDDPSDSSSMERIVPMVEAHLERSQQLPLSITFRPFYETHCTETEQSVLDLLAEDSYRWEKATISGSSEVYSTLNIRDDLPILHKLDLTVSSIFSEHVLEVPALFQSCPALQEAFINSGRYGGDLPVTVNLPFEQLLRYSASNPWTYHVRALHSAVNLVDCVLRLTGSQNVPTGSPVVLPYLRRLSTSTASVLGRLDTPLLRELYCCDHSATLHAYLKRLPELQRLFVGETTSATDIGCLLHAAPTVTNLFLYLPLPLTSDLFSLLEDPTTESNKTAAVPALRSLSLSLGPLDRSLGNPIDEDRLMRIVESRCEKGHLRSLNFYATRFTPSPTTLERIEVLGNKGMQIELFKRSNYLYGRMVPSVFQLFHDPYSFYEEFGSIFLDSE